MKIYIVSSAEGSGVQFDMSGKDWCGVARLVARNLPGSYLMSENGDTCKVPGKMRGWCRTRSSLDAKQEDHRRAMVKSLAPRLRECTRNPNTKPTPDEVKDMISCRLITSYDAFRLGFYKEAKADGNTEAANA